MQLPTAFVVALTTTTGGTSSGGFDSWTWTVEIPGACVAIIGIVLYGVGVIKPLAVKRPRYWHVGGTTQFSCIVRNRSFLNDRTVTSLTLVDVPGWVKRTVWPFWKRRPQTPQLVPWNRTGLRTLGKRDELSVTAELREGTLRGTFTPGPRLRILAHAGSRSSRSKRLKKARGP
jgi:hypothetical protein